VGPLALDGDIQCSVNTAVATGEDDDAHDDPYDEDEPFMEAENIDTGNPALNKVLSELRRCDNETNQTQYKNSSPNPEGAAEAWNALGLIRIHMQHNPEEARKCHLQAQKIYKQNSSQHHGIAMATTLEDLGLCYERLRQHRLALDAYQEALQILRTQQVTDDNIHLIALHRAISRTAPNHY
jgi:tetratricopeptide (TPR) repeat protein